MKDKTCILEGTIQRVKEMAGMVIMFVFVILLCILCAVIGIVWLLADCTVRGLEKVGCL